MALHPYEARFLCFHCLINEIAAVRQFVNPFDCLNSELHNAELWFFVKHLASHCNPEVGHYPQQEFPVLRERTVVGVQIGEMQMQNGVWQGLSPIQQVKTLVRLEQERNSSSTVVNRRLRSEPLRKRQTVPLEPFDQLQP
jgi:hypothetical protein